MWTESLSSMLQWILRNKELLCVLNTQQYLACHLWNCNCFTVFSPCSQNNAVLYLQPKQDHLNKSDFAKTALAVGRRKSWPLVLSLHGLMWRYPNIAVSLTPSYWAVLFLVSTWMSSLPLCLSSFIPSYISLLPSIWSLLDFFNPQGCPLNCFPFSIP